MGNMDYAWSFFTHFKGLSFSSPFFYILNGCDIELVRTLDVSQKSCFNSAGHVGFLFPGLFCSCPDYILDSMCDCCPTQLT